MGGRDKGLVEFKGKPLIEYCLTSLQSQVADVLISCNRNLDQYAQYQKTLVEDSHADFQGPLAGIEACLGLVKTPYALIFPCDSVSAPSDLAQSLVDVLIQEQADIVYLTLPDRPQYLIACLKVSLRASLSEFLDDGNRKVSDWYALHHAVGCAKYVNLEIPNLNRPEDLD